MFRTITNLILVATAVGQVKYKFDEDEFLLNRAVPDVETAARLDPVHDTVSNYFKTYKLTHKFLNEKNWEERSQVVVGYDQKGHLVEVNVKSSHLELKDRFE